MPLDGQPAQRGLSVPSFPRTYFPPLRESLKNTPCVADHDMMNADMFKQWVEGRLMPTFEALYG